eukprot:4500568-Karenia_brevis.AAC.1
MSRQCYEDVERWKARQAATEEAWPEYKNRLDLISKPSCLSQNLSPKAWKKNYLEHVQVVQEMKQHHVHTVNHKGERMPLLHCRRPDDATKCKSNFPRDLWNIDRAIVLCPGLLREMGMPHSGRRNM